MQPHPEKGKLPGDIPEPIFVANPNHRCKVLKGELIALAAAKKNDKTMTRLDATRLGKNYSYFIRSLPYLDEHEYIPRAKACLEHHFDNHEYCGEWCKRKQQTQEQRNSKERFYRSKTDKHDLELYKVLQEIFARFITLDRIMEVSHGVDTQK
jgi:hypothetical protein